VSRQKVKNVPAPCRPTVRMSAMPAPPR
jgi:hypothetical protein